MFTILFLSPHHHYLNRMSRDRFDEVEAIEKYNSVIWSGIGWENWDENKTINENIDILYADKKKPDLVYCYKPDDFEGLAAIKIPLYVNLDEIFSGEIPIEQTVNTIKSNKIDIVNCYKGKKQISHPLLKDLPCKFLAIPHTFNPEIFKDWQQEKTIDVLLIGLLAPKRYPFRARLKNILLKMKQDRRYLKYNIGIHQHPGYKVQDARKGEALIELAKKINSTKIVLTCSGRYHFKYLKYVEVPACRSLLMADMPDDDREILQKYLSKISPEESDESIIEKIVYYLERNIEREKLTNIGYNIAHESYTHDHFAKRFQKEIDDYFLETDGKKVW